MDETSANKILEFSKILYEQGKYTESKELFSDFSKVYQGNKKNISKVILALWMIYSISIIQNNNSDAISTFILIKQTINILKTNFEEEFKNINFDSVKIFQ